MRGKLPIVVVVLALAFATFKAHAADTATCELITISASNSGKGIDPALSAYTPIFKQAPFSKFNSFKLEKKVTYKLELGVPNALTLPPSLGGFLRLNAINSGKLDLTLTLVREGQEPIDIKGMASSGSPFFAAGLSNPEGVWIFGVVCNNSGIISH